MKKVLLGIVIGVMGWQAWTQLRTRTPAAAEASAQEFHAEASNAADTDVEASTQQFSCDGRTRCTQMTSCAEAEYFLQNCPGVEMDGNNDGEPCESQWCGNNR